MNEAKSAILTYHSLDETGSVISTSPGVFRQQVECLVGQGVPVVRLADIRNSPGAVALTFDDGFCNFLEHGLPVINEYGLPATVFVVTGHCGGRNVWDRHSGVLPSLELMSWSHLRQIARSNIELGAHTVHHADLTALSEAEAGRELADCRVQLEDGTGQAVELFAYPYGACSAGVRKLAQRHFRLACGTSLRFVTAAADIFDLPRIDMYYLREASRFGQIVRGGGSTFLAYRRFLRRLRRML